MRFARSRYRPYVLYMECAFNFGTYSFTMVTQTTKLKFVKGDQKIAFTYTTEAIGIAEMAMISQKMVI